jgi:ribosomal protein S18 acetylase RimI-like enzyme
MEIRPLEPRDTPAIEAFLQRLPESDRTFFKEDVTDAEVIAAWSRPGGAHLLAVDGGAVVGYVAVVPLAGWSDHVGEVRVIVDPDRRGQGLGRALARRAVLDALELGLTKLVVEVVADQAPAVAMFRSLGFDPEALLKDHVRNRDGQLRDLMVLAHSVEASSAALAAAGIADSL